jgi:predicted Rossmann fold nucleotide-binding protein DprA/Smf involved in DNA uptake
MHCFVRWMPVPRELDEIVASSGLAAPAALAALTMLELDGAIESVGGSAYARVGPLSRGEDQHA